MVDDKDSEAALLELINGALSDNPTDALRMLLDSQQSVTSDRFRHLRLVRPRLRQPMLDVPVVLVVRVELDGSEPSIWRRLEIRSDSTLLSVHHMLQAAFAWDDAHLYRFSLGGGPFDPASELFLCPFDVDEGEDDGTAAGEVRVDEALQGVGDVLRYAYDYGDSWELTLSVEQVRPAATDSPPAICIGGRRAAPPEDCGGLTDADSLAEVLSDPAHFEIDDVNQALLNPFISLERLGLPPFLFRLLTGLRYTDFGDELISGLASLNETAEPPEPAEALYAVQWFLQYVGEDGIDLTAAGYLRPVDVRAASAVVPTMRDWIGAKNREIDCAPLASFRKRLQSIGLLRKYKGRLLLTRDGKKALADPQRLWDHLASRLIHTTGDDFDRTAVLLVTAGVAIDGFGRYDQIADVMSRLGWEQTSGRPFLSGHISGSATDALSVLRNVGEPAPIVRGEDRWKPTPLSTAAIALARAALRAQA